MTWATDSIAEMMAAPREGRESVLSVDLTPIHFGLGALSELDHVLRPMAVRQVAVLADPAMASTPSLEQVFLQIRNAGASFSLFQDIRCEPNCSSVELAQAFLQASGAEAIVVLGGGSAIDTAKLANLLASDGGQLHDYLRPPVGLGRLPIRRLLPIIALPTTAGSASEASSVAVVDVESLNLKVGVTHRSMRPVAAILDPFLTLSAPKYVTAACGLDLVCHALESLTARPMTSRPRVRPERRSTYQGRSSLTDDWALKAIDLGSNYLPRAVNDGTDLEARTAMMLCTMLAGVGYGSAGVHIAHACSYPIATQTKVYKSPDYPSDHPFVPHGFAVAMTAPAVFRFTFDSAPDRHLHAASVLSGADTSDDGREALPRAITEFMQKVSAPAGLEHVGYGAADLGGLVAGAADQARLLELSPKPVGRSDLLEIFRTSMRNW
ncbi:hydroxyacid-oxoacid transhydrogenase [Mesorhizobium sp. ArgA1]